MPPQPEPLELYDEWKRRAGGSGWWARLERNVLPDGRSYAERDDFVVGIPVGAGSFTVPPVGRNRLVVLRGRGRRRPPAVGR